MMMETNKGPLSESRSSRALSGPALRTFFRIAAAWQLSTLEQMTLLGMSSRSTYFKWKKNSDVALSKDSLERISYILGIYKALQVLLPEPASADAWIRRDNAAASFGGGSALSRMLAGGVADLYVVRQYLDAERSGW
jgi:hypothetical protein